MEITAVGIDVSKRKSTVAIRRPGGVIVACPFDISHSSHDLEKLVSILKTTGGDIRVVMEHTSNYWKPIALTLKNAGFYVSVVNAMLIHDFSDNSIRKLKTDRADSLKIANYALTFWNQLPPFNDEDETRLVLKEQSRMYERLASTATFLRNGLIALADQTFPSIDQAFGHAIKNADGHEKWVDFFSIYWHRDCVLRLSIEKFTESYRKWCLRRNYKFRTNTAHKLYALAQDAVPTLPKNNGTKALVLQACKSLNINEQEAEIVRLIFDKYVYEGYGAQRIATYLNNAGYRARSGKCWHPGSLRGMVGNLTYMGVLRCGDVRSELMPELQIIPQEEFEAAQRIREDRSAHAAEEAEHHVPLRTRGQALLSNNVYCGHCGARLALTTSRKWRKLSDGTLDDTLRIRYTCYGKLRKQTDCTGQTGYTMHILDEIIDKMVRQIFSRLRGIPKEQLITSRYAKETAERKNHLQALQAERDKAEKDLLALKTEILAVIKGESAFPKDTLAEMIAAQEKKHTELETLCEEASAELERNAELMANVSQLYEELISYADLYDSASFEAKKMIVSQLIRRVEVYRGYQIHVDFNFDLAQYLENSDELAC